MSMLFQSSCLRVLSLARVFAFALIGMLPTSGTAGAAEQAPAARPGEKQFVTISTGGFFGVYYPLGSAICRIVNQKSAHSGLYCSIRRSGGSVMNIDRLRRGEVNFAIVSSDILRLAVGGSNRFHRPDPFTGLRGVLSLYSEHVAILAGRSAPEARTLQDLRGRRLMIGPPNSHGAVAYGYLSQAYGLTDRDFRELSAVEERHQLDRLCAGTSDALVFVGGSPNEMVERALAPSCGARLLMVEAGTRTALLQREPQLRPAVIPAGAYPGQDLDIPTVATEAALVTLETVSDEVVAAVVRTVVAELPALRRAHGAMHGKRREDLVPRLPFLASAPAAVRELEGEADNGR